MIHNIHFIQRRLDGKSNAKLRPFALISLLMLTAGIFVLLKNN